MKIPVLVSRIQRSSYNDGPGLRTTVFLKGCFFRCPWCHNPETINPKVEIFNHEGKCQRCNICAEICPEKAITPVGPNGEYPVRDRSKCVGCMECVEACPSDALEKVGDAMSTEEIMDEVKRDRLFYEHSGGGMTVSGGDPLFHPEFTLDLLKKAKNEKIHTCLDTTASHRWEILDKLLDYVDIVLVDIKNMDGAKLESITGVSISLVKENALKMAERGVKMALRLPVIPGFNYTQGDIDDSSEYFRQVLAFAQEIRKSVVSIDLLPFHNFAEKKYESLDRKYNYKGLPSMEKKELRPFIDIFEKCGFKVTIGG